MICWGRPAPFLARRPKVRLARDNPVRGPRALEDQAGDSAEADLAAASADAVDSARAAEEGREDGEEMAPEAMARSSAIERIADASNGSTARHRSV